MQIRPIEVVGGSPRNAPYWNDAAWFIMENAGSGADGASQARAGDVTCLYVVGGRTYTLSGFAGGNAIREGNQAIECDTTNAPPGMLLGGWVDTPLVGEFGKVQCSGWQHNARVLPDASPGTNTVAIAVTGQPYVQEQATALSAVTGQLCVIVEVPANMTAVTEGNHAVFWRCL